MQALVLVNVFFALILGAFLFIPVTSNWAWLIMIAVWCVAEGWLARDANIKSWHFALLFIVLGMMELGIIWYADSWR